MSYTTLKALHILSMVLLFGTGLGSAYYKWMADRSGNLSHIAVTNRHVVLADWIFTTPTGIFQPISGLWMAYLAGLSLAVGVSVVQSLHPDLRLKWPNDIWLQDRKLAGILIETGSFDGTRYAVIGVGINVLQRSAQGLSTPPAWLAELLPDINASQTLLRVVPQLVNAVKVFEAQGFGPFRQRFAALDALAGRSVTLSEGTFGTAQGVDATGALLVHTSVGMKTISSSEVSVRPSPGKS